jgi:hypothetical protein
MRVRMEKVSWWGWVTWLIIRIGLASKKQARKRVTLHGSWLELGCGASWHQWWELCSPLCSQQKVAGGASPLVLPSVSERSVAGSSAAEEQQPDILWPLVKVQRGWDWNGSLSGVRQLDHQQEGMEWLAEVACQEDKGSSQGSWGPSQKIHCGPSWNQWWVLCCSYQWMT